jgi:hypothetical protein
VQVKGVEVRVVANAWRGYPSWVARRYIPLWIYFINRGGQTFDITYSSMDLVDEKAQAHWAIPPQQVVLELLGQRDSSARDVSPRPASTQGDLPRGTEEPRPEAPAPPTANPAPPTPGSPKPEPHGYLIFGLRPYEDPYREQAPSDTTQPQFSPFPPGLETSRDAQAIFHLALREGRLLPNTHGEGFVYFERAPRARTLRLRITARNEEPGGAPLNVSIPFTVH